MASEPEDSEVAAVPRPFDDSICWRCEHRREIRAARSSFVMCRALPVKYPLRISAHREHRDRSIVNGQIGAS